MIATYQISHSYHQFLLFLSYFPSSYTPGFVTNVGSYGVVPYQEEYAVDLASEMLAFTK